MAGAVLVDSNVILDVATDNPAWSAWSSAALESAAEEAILANPCLTKPHFSPEKPSLPTAAGAASGTRLCLISTAVLTLLSQTSGS